MNQEFTKGRSDQTTKNNSRHRIENLTSGFLTAHGWPVRAHADSPITGGDGNREFLVWARNLSNEQQQP